MADAIGYDELIAMLRGAARQIEANHEELSRLDSFGGDGDHGTTILRAMKLLEKAIDDYGERELKGQLSAIGWAVMGVDGGATGPLFGMFFTGLGAATDGLETLDAPALAAALEAGLAKVQKQTRAQVGDKTMLDAMVPAVAAARQAADGGAGVNEVLAQAAAAARQGAESTKELAARFGRAKNIGEQSKGEQDPGATSVALVFKGFAEAVR